MVRFQRLGAENVKPRVTDRAAFKRCEHRGLVHQRSA
jgi:hypothetical protein